MTERVCESCGTNVEPELQVSDKPAVLIVTPRYCEDCAAGDSS